MFSVIIPLYNKAPYIEKAIRSVAAQTFQEFELIIIDDGSTDESFAIAQNILSSLFPPLVGQGANPLGGWGATQQENQGVSTARNNGVKLAKYDYIAFLDADDWWAPTYLEEMKGLIEQFPEAGIYGSSYYKVKDAINIPANIGVDADFKKGIINYCQVYAKTFYMPLWTGATIIKKGIYKSEQGFKPQLKLGEDFDLWIRVAMKYSVAFLNKPLAYYNQDVELVNRAVGGRLYEPEQHMLFTDYSDYKDNNDFQRMFEVLAVYGLLPYYLSGKNKKELKEILSGIRWENHAFKYKMYYRILPKWMVKAWLSLMKYGYQFKTKYK